RAHRTKTARVPGRLGTDLTSGHRLRRSQDCSSPEVRCLRPDPTPVESPARGSRAYGDYPVARALGEVLHGRASESASSLLTADMRRRHGRMERTPRSIEFAVPHNQ